MIFFVVIIIRLIFYYPVHLNHPILSCGFAFDNGFFFLNSKLLVWPDLPDLANYNYVITQLCHIMSYNYVIIQLCHYNYVKKKKDCQRFIIISQLYTSSLDEPYSLKTNSSTTGHTSDQTCRFGCKHILKATGWWPLLFGRRGMDSPVAQLVEHSKLNREVPGSFPGWGIRYFPPRRHEKGCQRFIIISQITFFYSSTEPHIHPDKYLLFIKIMYAHMYTHMHSSWYSSCKVQSSIIRTRSGGQTLNFKNKANAASCEISIVFFPEWKLGCQISYGDLMGCF